MDVSDAPFYLLAVIRPRPEHKDEAESALRELMAGTHAEPGCVFMELTVAADDPDTWVMFEKFRSKAAWEEHMRTDHVVRGNAVLSDLLRAPTELQFYSGW